MHSKNVYSVIATYNGMRWIDRCLKSLFESSQHSHIVVVDNGSHDNTVAFIKANFPSVQLIETEKNLGFGQANNIGLKLAKEHKADYTFLLNQDAWVEKDTIEKLMQAHIENPLLGIISPIHLTGTGEEFDRIFYDYLSQSDVKDLVTASLLHKQSFDGVITTSFVNAAAWLISIECLMKTGGFDPVFFHYGEDNNYAHRVLFKGFTIGILCNTYVFHDKEYPANDKPKTLQSLFKHDWIIFLHHACDIQNPGWKKLLLRRFCRYCFFTITGLVTLNTKKIFYNSSMVKNILMSFSKIRQSRAISKNSVLPYL